jgi:hypothetical protein
MKTRLGLAIEDSTDKRKFVKVIAVVPGGLSFLIFF